MRVQLKYATLPAPLGVLAVHYWFNILHGGEEDAACRRWEVWQRKAAGGESFGYLHCNLKGPDDDVGGGPARLAQEWRGEQAARLQAVLEGCAKAYPYCHRYLPWPGPNSNTFAAWVLRQAGLDSSLLSWKALGKRFA